MTVEALSGTASFDTGTNRLTVRSSSEPDYQISVPRDALAVDVFVAAASVFRVDGGRVVTVGLEDESGAYLIRLGG